MLHYDDLLGIKEKQLAMKLTKKQYTKKKATSDNFWRRKFMQVLEAIHDDSLHFNLNNWSKYGVSDHERKVILKEFERQQEWRASRENRYVAEVFDNQ